LYDGDFEGDILIETSSQIHKLPDADNIYQLTKELLAQDSDLVRKPFECVANKANDSKLRMTFLSVDTEELKGLEW
jgi:hypothetical protein